jgi:MinD-like ATPase involved in chromosome partitioning or flagellar assembly
MTRSTRPSVALALPPDEAGPVAAALREAGYEAIAVGHPDQLAALVEDRGDVAVAVLDAEGDLDTTLDYYAALHGEGRSIPALLVVSPASFGALESGIKVEDEYLTRPYGAESIRWRIEAMCLRSASVEDGMGGMRIDEAAFGPLDASSEGSVLVVFNPKGGVGKTTLATNLGAAIQGRDLRVLLIDGDTVTGHILTSLGIEGAATVTDAWTDEAEYHEAALPFAQLAAEHTTGMRVLALTNSPLAVEVLDPERIAAAIEATRRSFDIIIVDLHPSYSALNRAFFSAADRIIVPVTPDVPALRAAIQLREVAEDLGIRDRLAMVVNRANSGLSIDDIERTVGMTSLAQIRSGGLAFVRAANEGKTVIERYPKDKVAEDIQALADRFVKPMAGATSEEPVAVNQRFGLKLFNKKEAVRT